MASIRLFKGAKILEDENFIVEDINDYLSEPNFSSLTMKSFNIQMYDTSKMDVSIKIQAESESIRQGEIDGNNYNYALVNTGTKRLFYFIRKISYIAPLTYQVDLHLDVLNSFYNRNYISPLTHITRQHKDRYKPHSIGLNTYYFPSIDRYSEGLNPKLYKTLQSNLIERYSDYPLLDNNWYLIFRSPEQGTLGLGIEIYLVTEAQIRVKLAGSGDDPQYLMTKSQVMLTDSKLVKIIKLPYSPAKITQHINDDAGGHWIIDSDYWEFASIGDIAYPKALRIRNTTNFKLENLTGIKDNLVSLNRLKNVNMNNVSKSLEDMRSDAEYSEPKMFHSDFYHWKYVYDSFVKVVKNELVNNNYTFGDTDMRSINFYVTKTINSRFMFDFTFMNGVGSGIEEDFSGIMFVARNNEETIYNDEFINYIKTGFNYDVKNKQRQETFSWLSTGIGLTAGAVSLAVGSKALGVGLVASSVMSIANSINNTIQLETNMEQKIAQLKQQGMSVYGADDVDLMSIYNHNNKLWRAQYECSPRMQQLLRDLFYYTGYIEDVNEIPVTNTRMWFNYLQCEIHFKSNPHMNKEQLEEFKGKFLGGVTFLHSNVVGGLKQWDFDRERENWERVFFNN